MAEVLSDPSRFFVGDSEFAETANRLGTTTTDIPREIAPHFAPLWMEQRPTLLSYYEQYVNNLIDKGEIMPPIARLDKVNHTGAIINPGRGVRPVEGESPLKPGNEYMTPPSFLTISDKDGWRLRMTVNAFAYGYPRREILEDGPDNRIRRETVPLLSVVVALNPKKPLYEIDYEAMEFMQLWSYALAQVSIEVRSRGVVYSDRTDGQVKFFDSFIAFGNIAAPEFIKDSGGSVETPHTQIIFYAKGYAPTFYEGMAEDENGKCGRCIGVAEKLRGGVSGRMIAVREKAILYVPETEVIGKGESIRVTTRAHYSNWGLPWGLPIENLPVVRDMVDLSQRGMYAMATRQGKPAFNVIWAQGQDGHMFTQIQTGTSAGGFATVAPVFRIGDGKGGEIKPDTSYFDPGTIAKAYRAMESIFPPQLNIL